MDANIAQFLQESEKALTHLHTEYSKLQTGRANAVLVEGIMVEAYGQKQPLKAVAGISVSDAKTIVIQPWDKSVMANIEKAIRDADIGCNPNNDGSVIRLILPAMTEERRGQLSKVVHELAEKARITIRQSRQEAHDKIKEEKDEDVRYTLQEQLQKEVESANAKVEDIMKKKTEEIMTV